MPSFSNPGVDGYRAVLFAARIRPIPRTEAEWMRVISPIAVALLFLLSAPAAAQDISRGRTIVESHCSPCHATDRDDASPLPAAPPFRTLGERYPIADLEEALAEGIVTGHPGMPEFTFEPEEIADILGYLQSLQPQ